MEGFRVGVGRHGSGATPQDSSRVPGGGASEVVNLYACRTQRDEGRESGGARPWSPFAAGGTGVSALARRSGWSDVLVLFLV